MTNLEVARAFIFNALAYAKSGDVKTVINNLEFIEKLLENPSIENNDYDWGDFK